MATGATRDTLRRHNLAAVLRRVHRRGPQSRSALTQATGLNRSTVGTLVAELVDLGLVEEGAPEATGAAGRPSPLVRPSTEHVAVIAVDVAATGLAIVLGGLGGGILHRAQVEVDNDDRSYAETVDHIAAMVQRLRASVASSTTVIGLGVAAPGIVRSHDGYVHLAPNVGWRDRPLGRDLTDRLGPDLPVVVANEAHLGARAEHLRGAGGGVDDLVYLSSEIGVGGGVIIGGQLQLGADGYSGEVGHVVVNSDATAAPCRCGSTGCLESETGALALLRLVGDEGARPVTTAVRRVLTSAADGDAAAIAALDEVGRRLGRGLAGLVNLLNPRRVVLGGWFADAFDRLEPGLGAALTGHTLAPNLGGTAIVPAALCGSSALVGAVEIALEPLLADPASSPALPTATTG